MSDRSDERSDKIDRDNRETISRLATVEEGLRLARQRLEEVARRTHELISSVNGMGLVAEEAHEQRTEILKKVDRIEEKLVSMTTADTATAIHMANHIALCEKRAARLEKLAFLLISAVISIMGFLMYAYFSSLK